MEFKPFSKLHRLYRDIIITEKLDGTNAQITIVDETMVEDESVVTASVDGWALLAGSRNRWITPEQDNFGFASWVKENAYELVKLGEGSHFGEWWGRGIQRGYGLDTRRFSLFNTGRWLDPTARPECCNVVPMMYDGTFDQRAIDHTLLYLAQMGSLAAPGYIKPEGIVVYHTHSGHGYKITLDNNDEHKGKDV